MTTQHRELSYVRRLESRNTDSIRLVVIHCTELPDLEMARVWGEKIIHPESRTGNSGHFYIDRDGSVEQWVPLERVAHHVRGFNPQSIGIELVNPGRYPGWFQSSKQLMTEPYPEAQIRALTALLQHLVKQLPALENIAGHEDLDTAILPAEDNPKIMVRRKLDPGPLFPWPELMRNIPLKRLSPENRLKIKNICVYCGSSPGKNPAYARAAAQLAEELRRRDMGLVYGGAAVGVMGTIADAMLAAGGKVIGVIPKSLAVKELAHGSLSELHVVASMHERKAMMADLADGFIALPGGWGTLEEIFEMLTWAQLGFHDKPCGLLNSEGYYDDLIRFLENSFAQQFVKELCRPMLMKNPDPSVLLDQFAYYRAPKVRKWVSEEEL